MAGSCNNLVWSIIVASLDESRIRQVSFVSRTLRRLMQSELFRKIDLAPLRASEVEVLYNDLFHPGDGNHKRQGFLTGQFVQTLTNSFRETNLDVMHKQTAACNILQALGRVSVLELEVTFSSQTNESFEHVLLPAMETFFRHAREKISAIRLRIYAQPGRSGWTTESRSTIASKLSVFFSIVPCSAIVSVELHNVAMSSLPFTFTQTITSSSLKSLSVKHCDELINYLPAALNLESFTLSSTAFHDNRGALEAAFRICQNSAATLSSLNLEVRLTEGVPLPQAPSSSLGLPRLSRIRLSSYDQNSNHSDRLFKMIFSHISAPMLRTLEVEMNDIFENVGILLKLPKTLQNLRNLRILWTNFGIRVPESGSSIEPTCFRKLEEECFHRRIALQTQIFVRCATSVELAHDFERLAVLARTIDRLTLDYQGPSMAHINCQNPILFPRLLHLQLSPDIVLSTDGWRLANTDILRPLLSKLTCPNLRTLEVNPYCEANNAAGIFDELECILVEGMYPSLESLVGRLRTVRGMTAGDVLALQQRIRIACQSRGVDCSKLCFILPNGVRQFCRG